jgi:thioredoxin 1
MRAILLSLMLLWSSEAFGQSYILNVAVNASINGQWQEFRRSASAVCVGELNGEKVFCTAGHTFSEAPKGSARTEIGGVWIGIDSKWHGVKLVTFATSNSPNDLAWLTLKTDAKLIQLPVAEQMPEVGADVDIMGYPSGGKYNVSHGTVGSILKGDPKRDFTITPAVVRGVSGGPVVCRGAIVGIVSQSDFTTDTTAVGAIRIRESLLRVFKQIPHCKGSTVAATDQPTLVVFSAEWCGPCKQMAPIVSELESEGVAVEHVDIDSNTQMAKDLGVTDVPAFVVRATASSTKRIITGATTKLKLRELLGIPDCARPAPTVPSTGPPVAEPPKPAPPMTEADPAPLPNVPPTQTVDIQPLLDRIHALENKKLPDIPVEIYDADTGALIGRRTYPQGQPIKLSTKRKVVK